MRGRRHDGEEVPTPVTFRRALAISILVSVVIGFALGIAISTVTSFGWGGLLVLLGTLAAIGAVLWALHEVFLAE